MAECQSDTSDFSGAAGRLIESYVRAGDRTPALPPGGRAEFVALLTRTVVDPTSLRAFTREVDQARRVLGVDAELDELSLTRGPELPVERILVEGLATLDDVELSWLAIAPVSLKLLVQAVCEAFEGDGLGAPWLDAMAEQGGRILKSRGRADAPNRLYEQLPFAHADTGGAAEEIIADLRNQGRRTVEERDTIAVPPHRERPRSLRTMPRWVRVMATAAAAALLIGVGIVIGGWLHQGGDARPPGPMPTLLASADVRWGAVRGQERECQIQVTSPIDGFVALVALAPETKPRVSPGPGVDDLPVKANDRTAPVPLPKGTTRAVFVVTPQPAGETIRRLFEDKTAPRYTPEQESEVRQALERQLKVKGYRQMAVGSVRVNPPPP